MAIIASNGISLAAIGLWPFGLVARDDASPIHKGSPEGKTTLMLVDLTVLAAAQAIAKQAIAAKARSYKYKASSALS
jgi:hypothetical protein